MLCFVHSQWLFLQGIGEDVNKQMGEEWWLALSVAMMLAMTEFAGIVAKMAVKFEVH